MELHEAEELSSGEEDTIITNSTTRASYIIKSKLFEKDQNMVLRG